MEPVTRDIDVNIEILQFIYDILRSIEKDQSEISTKQSQECSQKVVELQKQIEKVKVQIKTLPGIDFNTQEQLQKLENLRNQLKLKQELLHRYKDIQI